MSNACWNTIFAIHCCFAYDTYKTTHIPLNTMDIKHGPNPDRNYLLLCKFDCVQKLHYHSLSWHVKKDVTVIARVMCCTIKLAK